MTITFNKNAVKENNQINANKDFKTGKVYFVVDGAEERHSDKAGAFILLKLSITNEEKQLAKITTCLFFTDNLLWRVKSFCTCVGEDRLFDSERISADAFVGLEGNAITDRNADGYINIKRFIPKLLTMKRTIAPSSYEQDSTKKVLDDGLPF